MLWKFLFVVSLAAGALAETREQQIIRAHVQSICIPNGHADKVNNVTEAMMTFSICFTNLLEEEITIATASARQRIVSEQLTQNQLMIELWKISCGTVSGFKSCIYPLIDSVSSCLVGTQANEIAKEDNTILDKAIDYFCENNIRHVTELIDAGIQQCDQQKLGGLTQCNSLMNWTQTDRTTDFQDECEKYGDYSKCVVNVFKSCNNSLGRLVATAMNTIVTCNSATQRNILTFIYYIVIIKTVLITLF